MCRRSADLFPEQIPAPEGATMIVEQINDDESLGARAWFTDRLEALKYVLRLRSLGLTASAYPLPVRL